MAPSTRAELITRRTYNRPLNDEGTLFETWEQTVDRVLGHQRWLWERALGSSLTPVQNAELNNMREGMMAREMSVSGRTLWLGGTEVSKRREACQFNCSFIQVATVHDCVDVLWNLLQGCGVGFKPIVGTLNGFSKSVVDISGIPSTRKGKGFEHNEERFQDGTWFLKIGDSAEAWCKAFGKLLAMKQAVTAIVFDFSEIRPAGYRLKGYGWISSGYAPLAVSLLAVADILSRRAGKLLTRMDILDLINHMGTVLSSRRSAEIALFDYDSPEWEEFAVAKKECWVENPQRSQSNNSLVFSKQPSKLELRGMFDMMLAAGGSEPGFINGEAALRRAPWFKGVNPCAEILLGDKSYCNLVEIDLGKFNDREVALFDTIYMAARANYRQTCVNLDDGILQRSWHELNEFLRLCGVGVTGIALWEYKESPEMWQELRSAAVQGANSMADELGFPRAKAVTTIKPSGTLSKIMDTTEGIHTPLAKYIINTVSFGEHDPVVPLLAAANYKVYRNPADKTAMLVEFPVKWEGIDFTKVNGVEVNLETAVDQLKMYKLVMDNYVDHNCSITVSYAADEVADIVQWLHTNWDTFVGVSWLLRIDPTKSAADLGFPYLPQQPVTKEVYEAYTTRLLPVDINRGNSHDTVDVEECVGGVCPVR